MDKKEEMYEQGLLLGLTIAQESNWQNGGLVINERGTKISEKMYESVCKVIIKK